MVKKISHVRSFYWSSGRHVKAFTRVIDVPVHSIASPMFGNKIKIRPGYLRGWKASMLATQRQRIILGIATKEGYATAVKRLVALKNISPYSNVDKAVNEDLLFLKKTWGR